MLTKTETSDPEFESELSGKINLTVFGIAIILITWFPKCSDDLLAPANLIGVALNGEDDAFFGVFICLSLKLFEFFPSVFAFFEKNERSYKKARLR